MSNLVFFEHLVPFEMNLNEADEDKRIRVFSTYYHFGARLYECLHSIAMEVEQESDDFSKKAVTAVLKMLKLEHFLSSECLYPPVPDLLDIIENRKIDDTQVLFKISDCLDEMNTKRGERFVDYDPSDHSKVPLNLAVDAMTSVANMAYSFLATTFAEELMKTHNPDGYDEDSLDDDDDDEHFENEIEASLSKFEKRPPVIHYRKLPRVEPIIIQQNAMLLLACRVGIVEFVDLSKEVEKLYFEGDRLSKITPLMEAAASSSEMVVRRLLELGADPNMRTTSTGNTALIYAASTDGRDVVREILMTEGQIKPDVYIVNHLMHDAMMEVALVGGADTLKEFLENGHKPKFLHIKEDMRQESALTLAAYKGHIRVVTTILDYYEKNPPKEEEDIKEVGLEMYSALMEAAMDGHIEVCRLMLNRGTPTDMSNPYSFESPLTLACSGGYPEVVDVLLSSGARIEEMNEEKNTPLMEACREGHSDVVKVLLSRGADVNAENPDLGDTPCSLAAGGGFIDILQLLMEKGGDLTGGLTSAIVEASQEGKLETVQFILAHCNTIPQDQLGRALVCAADRGSFSIVLEMVRAGADLNFEHEDRTALMKASRGDHLDIVQLLINRGASVNYKSSKNDATALSLACSEGHTETAQYLIRRGADPMLKMEDGVNCFMEVARHGSCDLMSILIEFTKGNMPIEKDPPNITVSKFLENKIKQQKGIPLASDMMMMLNGMYASKKKGCKHGSPHDFPYTTHEVEMLTHVQKLQQQMTVYEAPKEAEDEARDVKEALRALASVYGLTNEGKINFPIEPSKYEMEKLNSGEMVPSIKQWAELVSHGWLEMERQVGKPIELSTFLHCSDGHTTNAAAAVSAAAAAATGMDSQTYLASVFAKMNNGEEMPRVPATVGSLNAASAAMTGINFQPDEAMRLFGGASLASKMILDKTTCTHSQYAAVQPIQESVFRAALLKMGCAHKDRKPIMKGLMDEPKQKSTPKTYSQPVASSSTTSTKMITSVTVAKDEEEVNAGEKAMKFYPGIIKLAGEAEKAYRNNPTDANFNLTVLTAYIASTIPNCNNWVDSKTETPDRILRRIFSGKTEKQANSYLAGIKDRTIDEGSHSLKRSVEPLGDLDLKKKYLSIFRNTAECSFYDQCLREKNHQVKVAEKKTKSSMAVGGTQTIKSQATKATSSQPQQQGQLRRTHSEGDGAERAKTRSNAIDKATDSTMETPLTIACANGHKEIVELLLKEGANIEHRDKKGFSPLIIASTSGHAPVVEILLKNHAAIEAQSDRTKDTALSLACSGGRKDVVELLLAHGANKEHRNVSDYTPLSLASSGGYIDIVNLLINAGSEINSRTGSKLGISPLMLAAMNGHREATKVLLEKGSDINAQIETNRNTALTLASFQGRSDVVKLLLAFNANVEHRAKTGLTPLMEAASGGYTDVGAMLIDAGADTNAAPVPSSKDTALTIAAEKGHETFVRLLLNHDAIVDARNKKGCSPLWLACSSGHVSVVETLLEKNADPDIVDNRKVSPMMAAFKKGNVKIVEVMVKHAKQFPNDQDLIRAQQTAETDEIRAKCDECIKAIEKAKLEQNQVSNEAERMLMDYLEREELERAEKKAVQAEKRKKKKEAKKKQLEANKAPEPELEPTPEPEPELEPEVVEPEPEPEPVLIVEEPPKEPAKPRRNRKKTNPNGVPKDHKVVAEPLKVEEEEEEEKEPAEIPYEPIVVTIPPPQHAVNAPMQSPDTTSEADDWCKAGKEGKKVRPNKKFGSHQAQSSAGSSQAKESSTTSSVTSENHHEVDTKQKKHYTLSIHGLVMPRVIGRSGSNINAVREATGATIEIEKQGISKEAERLVVIRGSAEAVQNAVSIIYLLINDAEILIVDAIRNVLRGNSSVASSASSDGTSKSAVDSNSYIAAHSSLSAHTMRQSPSSAIHQQRSSKQQNHHNQREHSSGGANVWHQRMAARQEKTELAPTVAVRSQPLSHQQASNHPVARQVSPKLSQSEVPVITAPEMTSRLTHANTQALPQTSRVIAPPAKPQSAISQHVSAVVTPMQHADRQASAVPSTPEAVQRSSLEPIGTPSRRIDPISRPSAVPAVSQSQASFSKAPGTRPHVTSHVTTSGLGSNPTRSEIFDEPLAFGQFKSTSITALSNPLVPPSTSSLPAPVEGKSATDFDLSKFRMFDDEKISDIWSKPEEDSAWGGLFSQFLPQTSTSSSLNNTSNNANIEKQTGDWSPELMSQIFGTSSNNANQTTSSISMSVQPKSTTSVPSAFSALEQKGWMPSPYASSARDPNRSQPPLFARSPTNSTTSVTTSSLQQQQQQHLQQQLQHQQALQQQQRLHQQLQQQYQQQQPQHSPQSSLNDVHTMNQQRNAMLQQQQMYNQMHTMSPDPHAPNIYSQLAAQLLTHQETASSNHSSQASNQLPSNYYQSPSYTDSSVLGQLNMSTMSQRGIKQFDGFHNDSPPESNIIAALLEQQNKNSSSGLQQQPSFMSNQPQPFGTPASSLTSQQSRLGLLQSRQQPPPFGPPQAPPGFGNLGASPASSVPGGGASRQQIFSSYAANQQPQTQQARLGFGQMQQAEWNRQLSGLSQPQQPAQQQASQQPKPPGNWNNW